MTTISKGIKPMVRHNTLELEEERSDIGRSTRWSGSFLVRAVIVVSIAGVFG